MKRYFLLLLTVCFLVFAAVCAVSTAAVNVTEIKVSGPKELARGYSGQFTADITPTNASSQNVKWSVTVNGKKTEYASVDSSGKVIIKGDAPLGTVIVLKATAQDGSKVSGTLKITVRIPVKTVSIQNKKGETVTGKTLKLNLSLRKTYNLNAVSEPAKASSAYTWKSSNRDVASVNSKGEVSFRKNGTVTITATARDGTGKNASVSFDVLTKVTGIELSGLGTIEVGETRTIKAKVIPSTASNKNIEWSVQLNGKSSKLVTVDNGKVTVNSKAPVGGIIKVTAAATDGSNVKASGEMKITGPIPVKTITIDGAGIVEAGGSRKVKAVVEPADATNKKVKWSVVLDGKKSDLISISNGTVSVDKKVSGGSVITVTAAATDGSGVSAQAKMRIKGPVLVESITIEGTLDVKAGTSRMLTAVVKPSNATNKNLKWAVILNGEKSDLVTVNNGKVTVRDGIPNGSVLTVSARALDGSDVSARVKMTVRAPIPVKSIKLENAGSVTAGGSRTLTAVVEPSDASNKSIEWSVLLDGSKSHLVKINNGKITVDKSVPGGSVLTVKAAAADGSGVSAQKKISVISAHPVESIKLSGSGEIARGGSERIKAEITPSNTDVQKLAWSVREGDQETGYASISGNGTVNISGNAPAGLVITVKASATDGSGVSASKKIRITEPVRSISILDSAGYDISGQSREIRLNHTKELHLRATVSPTGASDKVKWTSSDKRIAEVSGGRVTFHKNGTVTITAAAADGTGKETSVYLSGKTYVTEITLDQNLTIVPGGLKKVSAKVLPEGAGNKNLIWYALLDGRSTGMVSIKDGHVRLDYRASVGSVVTVVAEAADGSGVRAMTELSVIPWVPVNEIKISSPDSIAQGKSLKLKATVIPSNATNRKLKWSLFFRDGVKSNIDIASNGTLTVGNDVPAGTVFTVRAQPEDESFVFADKTMRVTLPTQNLSILDGFNTNLTGGSYAVRLNETREIPLTAGIWPAGASGEISWTSSDPDTARVDSQGTVHFRHDGVVTITVTAKDGTGTSASVEMNGITFVSEIRINGSGEIDPGETRMLSADIFPTNAANKNLNWIVQINGEQTPLAGISNGQLWVSPNAPRGSVLTVIAMAADAYGVRAEQSIRIGRQISVQSISMSGAEKAFPGTSVSFRADVSPHNASNQTLHWTLTDNGKQSSYANISEDGTVTIDSRCPSGSVLTVTAAATDGSGVTGSTSIRVIAPLQFVMIRDEAGMNLSGRILTVNRTDYSTLQFQAVPYPMGAENSFVWQSSDNSVASVDGSGNVRLYRDGMVSISITADDDRGKSASVILIVTSQVPLSGLHIEGSGGQAEDGTLICDLSRTNVLYLTAVPEPAGASGDFVWTSSDPETASVDSSGKVVFRYAGLAFISVYDTLTGISAEIPVLAQR